MKGSGAVLLMLALELLDEPPLWLDPETGGDLFGDPGIVVAVEPDWPGNVA